MADQQWRSTEVLAWSRADGPERSKEGPSRWALGAVGATLAVTITGIVASDTLCPDHRLWVQALATVAIVLSITSVVQIMRAQSSAGLFALGASVLGVAIGLIDAVHAPDRGRVIAAAFGFAALASAGISLRIRAMRAWDDQLARAHTAGIGAAPIDEAVGSTTAGPAGSAGPVASAPDAGRVPVPSAERVRR